MNAALEGVWRGVPKPDRSNAGMWAIGAGHAMSHAGSAGFFLLLPFLAKDLGLSYAQVGLIISVRQLMSAVVNVPAGVLVDTLGKRNLFMGMALAWATLPYLFVGVTSNYLIIVLSMALVGVGNFLWHPAAITALSELYPTRRGYGLSLHDLGASLGDTLTPLFAGLLLAALNWRNALLIIVAAALLLSAIIVWMMTHASRRLAAVAAHAPAVRDYLRGLRVLVRNGRLMVLAWVSGVRSMAQIGLSTFLPLYMARSLHVRPALMGLYLTVVMASGMVATPIAGTLSDRIGPKRIAIAGMFGTTVAIVGFAALSVGSPFVAALAVVGFFIYSLRPTIFRWGIAVVPREYEGAAVGVLFTTQAILPTVMPVAGGYLGDHYGLLSVFYMLAATVLAANVALLFVPDAQLRRPAAEEAALESKLGE